MIPELLSLLKNIQQQSLELLEQLKQEKQALDDNQTEKLRDISTQKQRQLEQLQALEHQRTGYISSNTDFNQLIASSKNQALIKQWSETRGAIKNCQQQNEINGRILHKQGQMNLDILSILTGHSQHSEQTYSSNGSQSRSSSLFDGIKA